MRLIENKKARQLQPGLVLIGDFEFVISNQGIQYCINLHVVKMKGNPDEHFSSCEKHCLAQLPASMLPHKIKYNKRQSGPIDIRMSLDFRHL